MCVCNKSGKNEKSMDDGSADCRFVLVEVTRKIGFFVEGMIGECAGISQRIVLARLNRDSEVQNIDQLLLEAK